MTTPIPIPVEAAKVAKSILVVDDAASFRRPIETTLRAEGFEVLTASNGLEALAAVATQNPDLVLLDLRMPVMDGLTTLKRIRDGTASRETPVIVLSAASDRAKIIEAAKLGISGYLIKARFSIQELLKRARHALQLPDAELTPAGRDDVPTGVPKGGPVASTPANPAAGSPVRSTAPLAAPRAADIPGVDLEALSPLMTRTELLEKIHSKQQLLAFSPAASRLLKITGDEHCSIAQIADAVAHDPTIAIKILKLANSSLYSRGDRVDTVRQAVARIGSQGIRQAVMNVTVVERFNAPAFSDHLSTGQFWEHAIACGIIASEIARAMGDAEPDTAFAAGLLHDLGRVILAEVLGDQYIEVIETASELDSPLDLVESRMLRINHAEVMDGILCTWNMPRRIIDPIVFHHLSAADVRRVAPLRAGEVLRLVLANRLVHALLLGNSGNETIYPTHELCASLKITPGTVSGIEASAQRQTDDAKFALLSDTHTAAWQHRSAQIREALGCPFRPLFVGACPELDAYRIFCAQLADPATDLACNVAIVHISAPKERAALSERLVVAEREAGLESLPVLVLTPPGQRGLDDQTLGGRNCQILRTPTPVKQFVDAIRALRPGAARAAA